MSKHTPGDWYVETDERYGPGHAYIRTGEGRDGVHICTMNRSVGHRLTPPSDIAADARLIAAAPVLRAALTHIINARDHYAEHNEYPSHPLGPNNDQCFDDWAADLAERALDMAGGAK